MASSLAPWPRSMLQIRWFLPLPRRLGSVNPVISPYSHYSKPLSKGNSCCCCWTTSSRLLIVVPSRMGLRGRAEHEFVVPPLSVPTLKHLPDVRTLSHYEAVALFIE